VPLFQEQAMQIAIDGAASAAKADKLRRAMATFRRSGTIHKLKDDFIEGMVGNELRARVRRALLQADRGLRRIRLPREPRRELRDPGLRLVVGEALLPEVFAAALLNSQPMGFYAPAQLVRDAASTASRCGRPT
jgi:error-prone DNA polymerase